MKLFSFIISLIKKTVPALVVLFFVGLCATNLVYAQDTLEDQNVKNIFDARVDTANASLAVKVAPGELLPVSVKLLNFGGTKKVDVLVTYQITNSDGKAIYTSNETVAVETTASFVRTIQIPFGTLPGKYSAKTSLLYKDQLVPATTQFQFTVEHKILGIFQSDFLLYGGITLLLSLLAVVVASLFRRHQKANRLSPHDYSKVPADQRIFYEMLSDTIMQMRLKVGTKALEIASHIEGLSIDKETGKVLNISEAPSKVIASLVSGYERSLGEKVNFTIRK